MSYKICAKMIDTLPALCYNGMANEGRVLYETLFHV